MKARIPKGMGGGPQNMNAMIKQAQKMQEDMEALQAELDEREYDISAGGGMVNLKINGKKATICSMLVKPGDVITVHEKSTGVEVIKASIEANGTKTLPKWLDFDANTLTGKVLAYAQRDDIDLPIAEHLIVELYSK